MENEKTVKVTANLYLTKFEVFGLSLIGLGLTPLATKILVELFKLLSPTFGLDISNCSEGDFWLNGLYGIVLSSVIFCIIPSISLVGLGLVRIMKKQPHGPKGVVIGAVLTGFNLWLGWTTAFWYTDTSTNGLIAKATEEVTSAAKAQEDHFKISGAYATDTKSLIGDFSFLETGTVNVISAGNGCYIMEAKHNCLVQEVVYDSCNGGVQPIKALEQDGPAAL